MPGTSRWHKKWLLGLIASTALVTGVWSDEKAPGDKPNPPAINSIKPDATPARQLFKGKVVKMFDALKRHGVKAYAEELKDQVALETAKGELIPILPDWRGRAFVQDERLRERNVELVGFRRDGIPFLNVMSVYTFDEQGQRQYTDYWCDVCSIPMYEIKPCDCCQQEIRLRFQRQEITELDATKPAPVPKSK
jgi:hypothetical protein